MERVRLGSLACGLGLAAATAFGQVLEFPRGTLQPGPHVYHLALRNKRFHRYNRFYLLSAIVISLLLPFLNIPVYFTQDDTDSSIILRTLTYISSPGPSAGSDPLISSEIKASHGIQPIDIFYAFYICALTIAILRILFSCIRIRSLARNNPAERIDNITFINTSEPGTPFSFFRWLFWNRAIELRSPKGEQIFKHELFHIRQKHIGHCLYRNNYSLCMDEPVFLLAEERTQNDP